MQEGEGEGEGEGRGEPSAPGPRPPTRAARSARRHGAGQVTKGQCRLTGAARPCSPPAKGPQQTIGGGEGGRAGGSRAHPAWARASPPSELSLTRPPQPERASRLLLGRRMSVARQRKGLAPGRAGRSPRMGVGATEL